ncbi:helix-turn-helix transcriptional regulator (plasmid) [Ensifer sp. PDNC004]|uniref:winged helix-turn-helix transcriptional regulator n=1 Tax=Ensifer sp. PDNC004 TaxID=2811423 RepID=UPI001962BA74|nr:helix-turn-helix domain-containing protein [Ensifer sp. PDNC004]QRY65414.1 helix-turn-helix transcriptional regulator [Ensifer sp. PDNC004]
MVARRRLKEDYCPSARSLDAIGDWWSLLIVRDAFDDVRRFSDFQKSLGIAKNILTERLKTLVERGILETVPAGEAKARVEYQLTAMGRDLFPVMVALRQFGEKHLFQPGEKHSQLVEKETGLPVKLDIRTQDGKPIDAAGTVLIKVPEA